MSLLTFLPFMLLSISITILSSLLWTYIYSPLNDIPGPFPAKFTNIWRLLDVYNGHCERTQQLLHQKYGSAVRLGPNVVSLSDPKLLKTVYAIRGDYLKSDFYSVNSAKIGGVVVPNQFSTQSNEYHTRTLRPIQKFYRMSHLLKSEPLIDGTIRVLMAKLDVFARSGKTCRIEEWLLFFAWDVITELTFSQPMGFLAAGRDFDGSLRRSERALDMFAVVGQMPVLDWWLAKNPVWAVGPPVFGRAQVFCIQQAAAREAEGTRDQGKLGEDMLGDFLRVKRETPGAIDDGAIIGALIANVLAGADTTALTLCAVVYYVLRDVRVYERLQRELDDAGLECPVSYAATEGLRYFDAVVREALRMHPGVGMLLERVVPEGGLALGDGRVLPPGTVVGMNAWVIHQDQEIFGADANAFNPDRWLWDKKSETEEQFEKRVSAMKSHDLSFGAGKRVCLGKNISILERYKVMATLFLEYDMCLVDPQKEWQTHNSWFVRQTGVDVKLRRRVPKSGL